MAPSTTACAIKSAPWTTPWLPGLPVVCRFFFGFFFAAQETFPGHFQDISRTMAGKKREGERGKPREAGDDRIGRSRSAQPWAASADARERESERQKCWLVRNPLAFRSSSAMSGVFIDAGVLGKRLEQIYRSWTDKVRSSGPCPSAIEPCLDTWTPGLTLFFFFFFVKRLKVSRLARAVPPRMPSRSRRERAPRTCGT